MTAEVDPLGWTKALLRDVESCDGRLTLLGSSENGATFSHPGGNAWLEARPAIGRILIRIESDGEIRSASFRDRNPAARMSDPLREAQLLVSRLKAASGSVLTMMDGGPHFHGRRMINAGWHPGEDVSSLLAIALNPTGRTGVEIAMGGAGQDARIIVNRNGVVEEASVGSEIMTLLTGEGRLDMTFGRSLDGADEWVLDVTPAVRRTSIEPMDAVETLHAHAAVDAMIADRDRRGPGDAP